MTSIARSISLPKDYSLFLFGPRQVGKSTLLHHSFRKEETIVYDLLDINLIRKLETNPSIFFDDLNSRDWKKYKYVVIDEVQKLPWILDEVHRAIESLEYPPYFILTGSSARKLKKSKANMLAGRAISKSLYPFIYDEISSIPDQPFSLYKTLQYGSLPKVYCTHDEDLKFDILQTYTNTYIKEEIKEEALVRNLGAFNHFLLLAANENGNVLNYSNIAQDVGVSYKMVKEYYQILLDTLMGFMLMPIQKSVRQQISKSPKFYFFDTGVQRALAEKLQAPLIKGTEEFGKVFEHWLIKEIIYKADYQRRNYNFSFYRVNDNMEVDLIIQKPTGEMIAIEIKASDNPKANKLSGLISFAKVFPEAKLICASLVANRRNLDSGIVIMPWQEVLAMI